MASDTTSSQQSREREQSLETEGVRHRVNGEARDKSDDASEEDVNGDIASENGDGDLFGDDDNQEPYSKSGDRKLDDAELDSGDDESRRDRIANTIEDDNDNGDPVEDQVVQIYPSDIGRMAEVEVSNGNLYVLNFPPFLGLKPENYDPETYEMPTTHHGMTEPPTGKFSPFSVASTTAFWRYDPQEPSKLQSNTRIVRWSDGSLTLQIASQPRDHYRIATTALRQDYGQSKKAGGQVEYNPDKDSQHYLSAPHAKAEVLRLIHPFSAAMKILPSGEQTDEAVLALQKSLAAAEAIHDPFAAIRNVKEDPELAKKRAELAEKDKLRAERKREAQIERETGRKEKVLGRRGLARGGVGLTIGGLEDEDGMPTAKARKPTRRGGNRRGDIYSDDEDDGYPRGRTREDEYDQDDGFLARSDEEPEIFEDEQAPEEDDPDVDDLEIDGREMVLKPKSKSKSRSVRQETPKRSQEELEDDATVAGSPHARKKRRVIDDDEDE